MKITYDFLSHTFSGLVRDVERASGKVAARVVEYSYLDGDLRNGVMMLPAEILDEDIMAKAVEIVKTHLRLAIFRPEKLLLTVRHGFAYKCGDTISFEETHA